MRLARLQIENFRHLGTREKPLTLDFTDALGRVRDFTLLVGPNTSGKTTILDAVAAALGRSVGMSALRPDFEVSPRTIVRRGELYATVTCWLRFTAEEIGATKEIFRLAEHYETIPETSEVTITWTYPGPRAQPTTIARYDPAQRIVLVPQQEHGVIQSNPQEGWVLLHGRDQATRLLATGRTDWSWLHRVGGVFTFDQDRTGLGKTISRQVWNLIRGTAEAAKKSEELRTTDPRTILIDLALQHLVPSGPSGPKRQPDEFRRIQETYAKVCAPRRIVGPVRDELGQFDIQFNDGENDYSYDGLSSGEKNILLFLIRFVAERMHQSIVLIDELELNQHPLWQGKLVHLVPRMGEGNQIIATTHSPYLRGAVPPEAVIDLGDLGESRGAGAQS